VATALRRHRRCTPTGPKSTVKQESEGVWADKLNAGDLAGRWQALGETYRKKKKKAMLEANLFSLQHNLI
jgi:hypothetical protein